MAPHIRNDPLEGVPVRTKHPEEQRSYRVPRNGSARNCRLHKTWKILLKGHKRTPASETTVNVRGRKPRSAGLSAQGHFRLSHTGIPVQGCCHRCTGEKFRRTWKTEVGSARRRSPYSGSCAVERGRKWWCVQGCRDTARLSARMWWRRCQ